MPRAYPHSHVAHERHVGYNLKKRGSGASFYVYFRGPDGRRLELDTQQPAVLRAHKSAQALIERVYAPAQPATPASTWDEAERRLADSVRVNGRRNPTIEYYLKLSRRMRSYFSGSTGPADISPGMAQAWKKAFASTPTRRKRPPSQHTVFSLVRGYNALWQKWFVEELGICPDNPWKGVTAPKTDRVEVKVIDDDTLTHFLGWLDERYGGWLLPRLFLETKALTGCRLMDLCAAESTQLRDGRLHFRADQTKGRKARSVPLPADLYAALDAVKGVTYLWESYPAGLIAAVKKMGCPTHRVKADFAAARLYHWIETLFSDYSAAHPDRPPIQSHQLRKRAFTAAWESGIDPRRAAIAIGCNPDTVMRHYVKLDEQQVTDEVMGQLAARLKTKPKPGQGA